jgi:uncharacterized protein
MASPFEVVERSTRLEAPADEVYAWHLRPGAFERLTPPWEHVRVLEHGGVSEGSRAVLRARAGPVPVRWVAVHRDVEPGRGFTDEQESGPFSHWVHRHRMTPDGAEASVLTDRIEFAPPYGWLGAAAGLWVVRSRLRRMLRYRHELLRNDLAAHRRAGLAPLHVAVSGASGLIGTALTAFLTTGGHRVSRIVRRQPGPGEIGWNPVAGTIDAAALEGVDAVVHLAGENLAGGRWTDARKRRIVESRVQGTRLLAQALAARTRMPAVLVGVSAVGIYGDRGDEPLPDGSAPGRGFLAETVRAWEDATEPAVAAGIRVVHPRFGVVLSPAGGALRLMLPAFLAGLGGRLGSGRQWMPWLSIDDAVGIIHHAIADRSLAGPLNAVAPEPVTNRELTGTLAHVLHRPAVASVPAPALRLALGELADAALLASARVLPSRLEAAGYRFRHPTLEAGLRHLLGRD